jgi:hypothetical protein
VRADDEVFHAGEFAPKGAVRNAPPVRERIVLALSVAVMLGGLAVWTFVSRHDRPDEDSRAYLASLRDPGPIGVELHPADPRGAAAVEAVRAAGLGEPRVRRLLPRGDRSVIGVVVRAAQAIDTWSALAAVGEASHVRPVILGDGFAVAAHAERALHTSELPEAIALRASRFDLDGWLAARPAPAAGTAVGIAPRAERFFSVLDPVMRLPILDVAIALLPIARGADAPAWLSFGNWRGCPEPGVHVAVLRRLEERAHAELVAITNDRVELRAASPPTDPAERAALAELLARWAPEAARADGATIASWADTLVTSRSWSLSFPHPR